MIFYILVIIGVFACSASQLLLKRSATQEHRSPLLELLNWRVIVAYGIMFISLAINIFAMSKGVQLKDLPILEATGYLFVPILSALFLKEKLSWKTFLSMTMILVGIVVFYI